MFNITHEKRKRVQIDCSEPILTDQSFAKGCDINLIMANYAKTGMLPSFNKVEARYIDNTQTPDLITAFNIANKAQEDFLSLPPEVRKAMGNNPAELENFISDENNQPLLIKHGVLIEKKIEVKESAFTPEDLAIITGNQEEKEEKK